MPARMNAPVSTLPLPPHNSPDAQARASRAAAVALLLALVALGLAWELVLAPTGRGTLALKVLPLLFFLTGLLKLRLASYRALSLLVWLYVAEGLVRATSEAGRGMLLAWGEVALATALFVVCVWHVQHRLPRQPRKKEDKA
ncbi:putative membrane protein [Burkholderiales bacterium JOSHI_001]|nr:putative membrane protein [Burkholderiales bacterium JOSHI_001]